MSYFIRIAQKLGLPVSTAGVCYGLAHEFNYYKLTNQDRFKVWKEMHRFITKLENDPKIKAYLQTAAAGVAKKKLLRAYQAETEKVLTTMPTKKRDPYRQQRQAGMHREVKRELIASKVVDDLYQVHQYRLELAARYEQESASAYQAEELTSTAVQQQSRREHAQHKAKYIDDNLDDDAKKLLSMEVFLQGVHLTMSGQKVHNEIFVTGTPKLQNREAVQALLSPTLKQKYNDEFRILLRNLKLAKQDLSRSDSYLDHIAALGQYVESLDQDYRQKVLQLDLDQVDHILDDKTVMQWLTDNQKLLPEIGEIIEKIRALQVEYSSSVQTAEDIISADQHVVTSLCSQLRIDNEEGFTAFVTELARNPGVMPMSFSLEFVNHVVSFCRLSSGKWMSINHDFLKVTTSEDLFAALTLGQLDQSANAAFVLFAFCRGDQTHRCEAVRAIIAQDALVRCEHVGIHYCGLNNVTPLYLAAKHGRSDLVSMLLKEGVDKDVKKENGWTALMVAAENGNENVVGLLLAAGVDKDAQNERGWSALMIAAVSNNHSTVRLLLEYGADKDLVNDREYSALMLAIEQDRVAMASLLIQQGALLETKSQEGETALLLAAKNSQAMLMNRLIDTGADINAQNIKGWSALHTAVCQRNEAVIDLLVARGINKEIIDMDGNTALIIAVEDSLVSITRRLLECGAAKDARDEDGYTTLMMAVDQGDLDIVRLLIDQGVSIDAVNDEKNTALMLAAKQGDLAIASALLNAGADKALKNTQEHSAFDIALENENTKMIALLSHVTTLDIFSSCDFVKKQSRTQFLESQVDEEIARIESCRAVTQKNDLDFAQAEKNDGHNKDESRGH